MIDQKSFFLGMDFYDMEEGGTRFFMGPNGYRYSLIENQERAVVRIADPDNFKWRDLIVIERVVPEQEMIEMLQASLQNYLIHGEDYIAIHNSYYAMADVVRAALGKRIGETEMMNLCNLYYRAIRYGSKALKLSETCKEVIRMVSMQPDKLVFPELHNLLLQVPDAYYDFVFGVENNLQNYNDLQQRVYEYLLQYPYSSTSEVIIYNSMRNAHSRYSNQEIHDFAQRVLMNTKHNQVFQGHGKNEILMNLDHYGWRIASFIINTLGYSFRQTHNLCLVDYMEVCIAGAVINEWADGIGCIDIHIDNVKNRREVIFALNLYMERMARMAGDKKVLIFSRPHNMEFVQSMGYEVADDIEDNLRKYRVPMIKEL